MFIAMGIMLACLLLGWLLRGSARLALLNRAITPAIMLLLFALGVSVGSNDRLMDDLPRLGGHALLLTLGGIAGSMGCVLAIRRFFRQMPKAPFQQTAPAGTSDAGSDQNPSAPQESRPGQER